MTEMTHSAITIDGLPVLFGTRFDIEAVVGEDGHVDPDSVVTGEQLPTELDGPPLAIFEALQARLGDRVAFEAYWNGECPLTGENLERATALYGEHVAPVTRELGL